MPGKTHYLPYRAVLRHDKETTKVRIVFDGSVKVDQCTSLNEALYSGPSLFNSDMRLFEMLVFIIRIIWILSNINQMFDHRNIKIQAITTGETSFTKLNGFY